MASDQPSNNMDAFRSVLSQSRNIIAVAGAGLSAASGIPTFRGAGGMWRKYEAMSLATPEAFAKQPSTVWQFYHMRRERVMKSEPNAAHIALARFSLPDIRNSIAPGSTFTLITQNVDELSRRALDRITPPDTLTNPTDPDNVAMTFLKGTSEPVMVEMHGRVLDLTCTTCGHRESNTSSPICPALASTEDLTEARITEPLIPVADLPHCSACGSLARPGVVWFGEVPLCLDRIFRTVEEADLCIVVGTSSMVQPAASFAHEVSSNGGKVAVFNTERSEGDKDADFLFLGPCEHTLPSALGLSS